MVVVVVAVAVVAAVLVVVVVVIVVAADHAAAAVEGCERHAQSLRLLQPLVVPAQGLFPTPELLIPVVFGKAVVSCCCW